MASMVTKISTTTDVPEEQVRHILDEFVTETGLDRVLNDTVLDGIRSTPTPDQPMLSTFEEVTAA